MSTCSTAAGNSADVEALFPAGTVPEDRTNRVSDFCSLGARPLALTNAIRTILAAHFADPLNLEEPALRRLLQNTPWVEGNQSGILIEPNTKWTPELAGKRPSLIIKCNKFDWQTIGIGDQAGVEWETGFEYFTGLLDGSHTILAASINGAEAQLLAGEVWQLLLHYRRLITEQLNLHRWTFVGGGEVAKSKEARDVFEAPVTFSWIAEESWRVEPHAPRTKHIVFRTSEILG